MRIPATAVALCAALTLAACGNDDPTAQPADQESAKQSVIGAESVPSTDIADVARVETVFKQGVGYSSERLFASVRGRVGLH